MHTQLFKKMFGECEDVQLRAVCHELREVGQECCKKGEYEAGPNLMLGPADMKNRNLVILPTAEWMKKSLGYSDETLAQQKKTWPRTVARVSEHFPENERDAVMLLMKWEWGCDGMYWCWEDESWRPR
jgi:hypothetical protein